MQNQQQEQVLVVPRAAFDRIGSFQGLSLDVNKYWALLPQAFFVDRAPAETNTDLKQIIPYQMVVRDGQVLSYARVKGESRLVSKRSVGIGGHINPIDWMSGDPSTAYGIAARRELQEELHIASPRISHSVVAWLNDDSDEVGKVHLGVVHVVRIDSVGGVSYGTESEKHIELLGFNDSLSIRAGEHPAPIEGWSRICLENFHRLCTNPEARELSEKLS